MGCGCSTDAEATVVLEERRELWLMELALDGGNSSAARCLGRVVAWAMRGEYGPWHPVVHGAQSPTLTTVYTEAKKHWVWDAEQYADWVRGNA